MSERNNPVVLAEPEIPLRIVEWLEHVCPDRCPSLKDSERAVWYDAGRASVAKLARQIYNDQVYGDDH